MANEFLDARLELHKNYGATFGPRYSTAVSTQSDGKEYRRALWDQPLIYATIGDRQVDSADLSYLLQFHEQSMGAFRGFRLRDWTDYRVVEGQGSLWGNGQGAFQMYKKYSFGGVETYRPLTKIVAGTTKLFANGVEQGGGWSVDNGTGVISTGIGGTLTFTCEFDVPVRFEQDKIDFTFLADNGTEKIFQLAPVNCTEIRVPSQIPIPAQAITGHIATEIILGYDYGTLGGPAFSTKTVGSSSEFEDRKAFWASPKRSFDLGDRLCSREDVDHLLSAFRVCRGRAASFLYYSHQTDGTLSVRFAEDRIAFRLTAIDETTGQGIYNLGGIALLEVFSAF